MPAKSDLTTAQLTAFLSEHYGTTVNADAVRHACLEFGVTYPTAVKRLRDFYVKRGTWNLTVQERLEQQYEAPAAAPAVQESVEQNLVPLKDETYVPFGNFADVKKIIKSGLFYPTFITGLSGNGKTFSVEQACAQLGREMIRVNITIETDEDDLIGGFRLVDGATVWHNGPVVEALERGAILLLDEVDLASNKILCLQSILEGKGVFLKKTGRYVQPTAGFNIIATANTKGKGSDDGRFIGTNVLNEAFLERFALTFEQEYPTPAVETKILEKLSEQLGCQDEEFCGKLATWAEVIRKTFNDGGIDEVISTRRLTHIVRAFSIFGKRMKAIEVCVNRFDDETKTSFIELYDKIDENANEEPTS
ncbi:CobS [Synechococcus phage S-CAM3]|uniref:CobS n=1 Tax=Synechococcus phage S-CAM3 TaxID=1883366 RepID=A0A1D8KJ54_9CAUD|nr:porphyrin biosynthesis [Synechococcus phage S-CAM3]AOV58659.1 CobS [Synechococcus phage S-CAM3]AOV58899.1 CobS [Synechococcus phage S-CAM3]AOV59138.1 CobS [Synechococcus phage S-CAM3]